MSPYETLLVENTAEDVVTITLNRPQRLNALTLTMVRELRAVFEQLTRTKPRALILTGAGRAFCAGADLVDNELSGAQAGERIAASMAADYNPMVQAFRAIPCPSIAAVNGVAAGGGASLALLADLVVAARSATFIQVFGPQLGLVPDLGATWLLPRLVGQARARGLALLGDRLDAQTAAEWGLIWRAVDDAELVSVALALATRLADGPTSAFREIREALDVSLGHSLQQQLAHELEAQRRLGNQPQLEEAVRAFREKRKPRFRP